MNVNKPVIYCYIRSFYAVVSMHKGNQTDSTFPIFFFSPSTFNSSSTYAIHRYGNSPHVYPNSCLCHTAMHTCNICIPVNIPVYIGFTAVTSPIPMKFHMT